jgi:acetoin utilization deacetylase AcuC-like enzyme
LAGIDLQGQTASRAYKEHGDEVVPNAYGADSTPTIEAMRPDLIVIGVDGAARDYYAQTAFTNQ